MPGIPEENIDVSVEEGVVRISGSSQVAKEDKGMRSYFMNAISSSYDYSFQLPSGLEDGEPKAELRRGILTLRFKKTRKEAPKKVKVVSKDEEKGEGDD
ncbi:MAG: Heat shock protein [Candidatus Daviesbacteria bacterium GW2011_GWA1_38_7]|nr:MAG: Heat shock protein [Candidatus Daviesbacteria bacterium GW2011_GWA1_38_7]